MATYTGRYGMLTLEISSVETAAVELNTWSMNVTGGENDTSTFGDQWGKTDVGMLGWNGTASGFYDPGDPLITELWAQLVSGALVDSIRLYTQYSTTSTDPIKYWKPDTSSDPLAGARITAFNTGQTHSGVATFDFSFSGSGPIIPISSTVP